MFSADDFQYALENTRLILAPRRQIETFGSTQFRFQLVTELMDRADEVRVRDGMIHAVRPQLLTPERYSRLLLEGFGERAQEFAEWLENQPRHPGQPQPAVLRYGFQFRRSEVRETVLRGTLETVAEGLVAASEKLDEGLLAILQGVDDAWEVCLLKFTFDLVQGSAGGNLGDLRRRGLI